MFITAVCIHLDTLEFMFSECNVHAMCVELDTCWACQIYRWWSAE